MKVDPREGRDVEGISNHLLMPNKMECLIPTWSRLRWRVASVYMHQFLLLISILMLMMAPVLASENLSPEGLFRHTRNEWMASMQGPEISWTVWSDFATTLVNEYEQTSTRSPSSATRIQSRHLEIVGAIEEGILAIERFLAHQLQQTHQTHPMGDSKRDTVLAELYVAYGMLLERLTSIECWKLASDPHTLLIGAPERLADYNEKLQDGNDELELLRTMFLPLCLDNADNAVRNAMSLDATNTKAMELLEKLTGKNDPTLVHQRKSQEFVAELFDSFADTFDEKLVGSLRYRVPELIGEAIKNSIIGKKTVGSFEAVLDAGCGTGLAGRHLRPMIKESLPSGVLVGVDVSSKMLDIAANCTSTAGCGLATSVSEHQQADSDSIDDRPLYDRLLKMDLENMTLSNTLNGLSQGGFDLIVAADVFVYFGSLEHVIQVFASLSTVNARSWLVFSCERALPEEAPLGFRLMPSGRFAHTKEHVLNMADKAGYALTNYNEIVPRMEKGEAVNGHLFVFELDRNADSSEGKEL